jgi:catechol 2,3-dioxygenase-like lactoylglutathione lyase family enzyme
MLDHVSITVSDIPAAERFYDAIMKAPVACVGRVPFNPPFHARWRIRVNPPGVWLRKKDGRMGLLSLPAQSALRGWQSGT